MINKVVIMLANTPPIYFYFPYPKLGVSSLPDNANSYWQWQCSQQSISPMQSGGCFWTLQTYLYLNDRGFPCQLVDTMPDEGIVVTHRDYLENSFQPSGKLLLVCLRADVDRHPYAQLHVVQNPHQAIPQRPLELWESHFMPHWPQPSIIPRDPNRGDTFENVTFLGNEINLVPEFREKLWYDRLKDLGLKFQKKLHHHEWHDYSSTDVILAIRSMGTENDWRGKPASKLYSGWHAGVPVILGHESAFRSERKSNLDYLEATSLEQLKADRSLRHEMVENGWLRAQETQPEQMVAKWQNFLTNIAIPAYQKWCFSPRWQQRLFLESRKSFIGIRPAYYQVKSQFSKVGFHK
jgi:hypothetical protein